MNPGYVAALEIGSSKIKGAVARAEADGRVTVLAVATERLIGAVRYGRVQNVQEVSAAIAEILRKLENAPGVSPGSITKVVIGLGGRSFATTKATARVHLPQEMQLTASTVERLERDARYEVPDTRRVVAMEPLRFLIGGNEVTKLVGAYGQDITGEFTAVTCTPETLVNLDRVSITNIDTAARYQVPLFKAIGEMVLTQDERQLGCALIDFGAETTTVSVWKGGALRFVATLPLGGRNITIDLMKGLSLTEDNAEHIKTTKATAAQVSAEGDRAEINNYTKARAGEIIANALNQIKLSDCGGELGAGIVVTGNAANLPGFVDLLSTRSKLQVRIAGIDDIIAIEPAAGNPADSVAVIALARYGAMHGMDDCLIVPEQPVTTVVDEPFAPERPARGNRPVFTDSADDGDGLLDDDPDGDEDDTPAKRGGLGSLFGRFGSKHKGSNKAGDEATEPETESDDGDEPIDEPDDDNSKEPTSGLANIMKGLANLGAKVFGNPVDEDTEDN